MKRMTDTDLTDESVKYAGSFVEKSFKSGRETEKSLVLNCSAHGFFCGARHVENCINKPWWNIWVKASWDEDELIEQSIKASEVYIKTRKFKKLDLGTSALIRASFGEGFRKGTRFREQKGD